MMPSGVSAGRLPSRTRINAFSKAERGRHMLAEALGVPRHRTEV
jgi:hypothetical protein